MRKLNTDAVSILSKKWAKLNEWHGNTEKPSGDFGKLLQKRTDKTNQSHTVLTKEEITKLEKPEMIDARLKRGENLHSSSWVTH